MILTILAGGLLIFTGTVLLSGDTNHPGTAVIIFILDLIVGIALLARDPDAH
jgi:hypothetical protein